MSTPAANAARFGDTTGENYGNEGKRAANDAADDLFRSIDTAQKGASKSADQFGRSADATAADLARLAATAGQGNNALALLPRIVALIQTAAASSSAGGGGSSSLLGAIGGLFSGGGTGGVTGAFSQTSIGGSGFGSGLAYGNADLGTFLHSGGVVGQAGTKKAIDASAMQYAARYHKGGMAGLKPNEVPAVLMGGPKGTREEVLHASDPRHADNGGRRQAANVTYVTNQNINVAANTDRRTSTQLAAAALDGARRGGRNR